MTGDYGSELQRRLQERTYKSQRRIAETPGLYNAGRFIGTDDPDKVGWPILQTLLHEQGGILGFRLISPDQAERYFPLAVREGSRVDRWDVFLGTPRMVIPRVEAVLAVGLPDRLTLGPPLTDPESEETVRLQKFAAENGVAPLPGSLLVDAPGQSTVFVQDKHGIPVAVANTYFAHNQYSSHHRSAWIGMVAVASALRGKGLGRYVSAFAARQAIMALGAESVHELIASTNDPSRRMAMACGLSFTPELLVGVAVPDGADRLSR